MIALQRCSVEAVRHGAGGQLSHSEAQKFRIKYKAPLNKAALECPPPDESKRVNKRGKMKRSKARNVLVRLINYENDVLRFMDVKMVPFTKNLGQNDIRMTKVQQKTSSCFRSMEGPIFFPNSRLSFDMPKKGMKLSETFSPDIS
ncbi:MAG: hypothetical protein COB71_01315 [Thiotrichales bacterium]|nr:MAG: hypothetical protein COB71_01315 [Thiotrichales bacterium]